MKYLAVTILVMMQVACSSTPKYDHNKACDSWIGKSSEDLLSNWGIPSNKMDFDGLTVYEYNKDLGKVGMFISGMYVQRDRACYTAFSIRDKTIVSYRWKGFCE